MISTLTPSLAINPSTYNCQTSTLKMIFLLCDAQLILDHASLLQNQLELEPQQWYVESTPCHIPHAPLPISQVYTWCKAQEDFFSRLEQSSHGWGNFRNMDVNLV